MRTQLAGRSPDWARTSLGDNYPFHPRTGGVCGCDLVRPSRWYKPERSEASEWRAKTDLWPLGTREAAIAAGAVLSSLAAIFVVDGPWALVALAAITPWVLAISGLAAFVGGWLGRESTRPNEPRRGVLVLVVFGVVGVGTWMLVAALI